MIEQNIVYYGDPRLLERNTTMSRPLKVVFLTSVRDTGTCDRNGTMVEMGSGVRYMEGAIERTVKETYPWWRDCLGIEYAGMLAGIARVVGVITDDTCQDMRKSSFSEFPRVGQDWIHPLDLTTPDGQLVRDITYNIPSSFRRLPLNAKEQRREGKYEFENRVFQTIRELGGDIVISDHYMAKLDYLWGEFSLYGRLLNIHPAVTVRHHIYSFRGPTPTADAIARARRGVKTMTGATLHFIGSEIDDGPPISYVDNTPVFATDEPQWLRYRNYQGAKLPLFINGLIHYVNNIYPHLNQMRLDPYNWELDDLRKLEPVGHPFTSIYKDGRYPSNERIFFN